MAEQGLLVGVTCLDPSQQADHFFRQLADMEEAA